MGNTFGAFLDINRALEVGSISIERHWQANIQVASCHVCRSCYVVPVSDIFQVSVIDWLIHFSVSILVRPNLRIALYDHL